MPHLEFICSVIPYVTISKYLLNLLEVCVLNVVGTVAL